MPNPNLPKATDLSYIRDQDELRRVLESVIGGVMARLDSVEAQLIAPPTPDTPPPASGPVASFTKTATLLVATFTDTSTDPDNNIAAWEWNFGDASTSTTRNPSHTYGSSGTYTVSLTVTDATGLSNSTTSQITVNAAAPADVDGTWGVAPRNGAITTKAPGTYTTQYDLNDTLTTGKRLDLTGTTFTKNTSGTTICGFGPGDDVTIRRGLSQSTQAEWDGVSGAPWRNHVTGSTGVPWHDIHGFSANSGGKRRLYDQISTKNEGDSLQIGKEAVHIYGSQDGWILRDSALMDGGDNCVENGWKNSGKVVRSFLSGMHVMPTSRPAAGSALVASDPLVVAGTYPVGKLLIEIDSSAKVIEVRDSILWLKGKRMADMQARGGAIGDKIVFAFFKVQTDLPTNGMSYRLVNNTWREDGTAGSTNVGDTRWGNFATSKIIEQSNNVLCMPLRSSGLPTGWPTSGLPSFTYLWGQAAKDYWNATMGQFITDHPYITVTNHGMF